MLQTVNNSEFSRAMDLFKEIDDFNDLFFPEKNGKLDSTEEGFEELQNKYSSLHETYAKEIENSKKVEKCLIKCLKFYSKLCKKYEVQQKIIKDLEESIKEKVNSLEEAQKNEEKMKGLIQVYRTERTLYAGETNAQLRKEKEILIDICCKLISESVKSHNISTFSNLLLRKFRKDLDSEKINMLKSKNVKMKDELECDDLKPDVKNLKDEIIFKCEEKYSCKVSKEDPEESEKAFHEEVAEKSNFLLNDNSQSSDVMSSLPQLDEFPDEVNPINPTNERQQECDVVINGEEFDSHHDGSYGSVLQTENKVERVNECSSEFSAPVLTLESHLDVPREPERGLASIFDITSDFRDSSIENQSGGGNDSVKEKFEPSGLYLLDEERSEEFHFESETEKINSDGMNSEDDSVFPYEKELFKIFREMTSVRVLSPIRETSCVTNNKKNGEMEESGRKRNANIEEVNCKTKKLKSEEEETPNGCLLDSILSAMSIQNEEFKSKRFDEKRLRESDGAAEGCSREFARRDTRASIRRKKGIYEVEENPTTPDCRAPKKWKDGQGEVEKLVTEEIRNFVSSPISSKEEADKNVKRCISVLKKKPEDAISKCIVATVLENIDEPVEIFERPAPPLTKTQHRLIVLLSVFRTLDWDSEKISNKILSLITEKLFPDNFFWPDDSVEAAARFYAALCRVKNDPKTLWKFCLCAMTEMRQRCPLLVFTVLKTWPDVLHDASALKNNLLAVTVVNIFLHMPKTEGLRNLNQRRKLVALKHLLMNFYQFKVEDTMEGFAKKLLDAVRREELGSEKSVVLLCKCRDQNWTMKNVIPTLKSNLADWSEGKLGDSAANATLSVIKHICPLLTQEESVREKVKDLAVRLSEILSSGKKNHDSEVNLIEVLLLLKHYPEARKVIREWIPKSSISESLRNEIINASAENILRELKLNRRETKNLSTRKKPWKRAKGKKKKGKKGKKKEQKTKGRSAGVCSKS